MKKIAQVVLLVLLFLMPTVGTAPNQSMALVVEPATADSGPQRIYGEDISQLIWGQITVNSFRNYVRTLTENGSRWVGTPDDVSWQNLAAREYIIEELDRVSNGRIEAEVIGEWHSIVGRLPGYLPVDAPAILVGGHYDSVPQAPGANDDGTGVATMLELARVLSQYSWPLDIYFGAWNAEEIGLLGSAEVASEFRDRGIELLVYYNIDMLLVPHPDRPSFLMVYPVGYYQDGRYWAELTQMMSMQYGSNLSVPTMSSDFSAWQRSDHWSFIQRGFGTSLFAHESGGPYDTAYHTSRDVWSNELYDYDVGTEAVRSIGAAIAYTMSRAYAHPTQLDYHFTLIPGHLRNYYIPISTATNIRVDCRWWGGGTSLRLLDPSSAVVESFSTQNASPWEMTTIMNEPVDKLGLYLLEVWNPWGTSTGHDLTITFETDIDGNDVLDSQEFWFDQSYFSSDQDGDSLSDAEEMIAGTSMDSPDSDSDAIPDPWELANGLDPLNAADAALDYDSDTLTNLEEYENGCNPWAEDSDLDSLPDSWEVQYNLDPTMDDSREDPDRDGVSNLDEFLQGTNPNFAELRIERYVLPLSAAAVVIVVLTTFGFKRRGAQFF
jgi:hypothetical protein